MVIRRQLLAFAFALVLPSIVWGQPSQGDTPSVPTLKVVLARSDYVDAINEIPPALRRLLEIGEGNGLLIEENLVVKTYPVLPVVFFDSGSTSIPDRYVRYGDSTQIKGFTDTTIGGGTLEKYYQILNIIGFRMQRFPDATLRITGCGSSEPGSVELGPLAMSRAFEVGTYLFNVWGIEKSRMTLVARNLPVSPSSSNTPAGRTENRRVEIESNDSRITGVVCQNDLRRHASRDTMHFDVAAGVDSARVATCRIEITRGGEHWATIENVTEQRGASFNWGRDLDPDSIPTDTIPYVARLIVETHDGETLSSEPTTMPVWIIDAHRKRRLFERRIDRFAITLFRVDDARLDSFGRQDIAESILPAIQPNSVVKVTGHCDSSEKDAMALSKRRAFEVANVIATSAQTRTVRLVSEPISNGVGATAPFYPEEFPEGRFFNRTVDVNIVTENPEYVDWRTLPP